MGIRHRRCWPGWVSRGSSYFYHRARITLEDKYLAIRHAMTEAFESNHRCYGYRRLRASIMRRSISISEKVVRRHETVRFDRPEAQAAALQLISGRG